MAVVSFQPTISREKLYGGNPLTTSGKTTESIFTAMKNPFAQPKPVDSLANQKQQGGFVYKG